MQMNQPVVNSTVDYDNFKQEADKKKEKMAEISFWISILMLIAAFVGVSLSVLIAILNYYFAAQGLKSKKRGKAIAAIVITSVSIVVIIIMVALTLAE